MIEGTVVHPRGSWTFRDPCLLTYEVSSLADWLDSVALGKPLSDEQGFVEPNICFRLAKASTGTSLQVLFWLECRPPWATPKTPEADSWLEFPVSEFVLRRAADSLRDQLRDLPQRASQ